MTFLLHFLKIFINFFLAPPITVNGGKAKGRLDGRCYTVPVFVWPANEEATVIE